MIGKLNAVCALFNLGSVSSYIKEESSQNNVYKVMTTKGIYVIKEYSYDAIKNYYHLNKRRNQIYISEIFNNNGIKCILPINKNNKYFILYNRHYYLAFPYSAADKLSVELYTTKHLKHLAQTEANIHNLKIVASLPCLYKKVNINFNKAIKKYKKNFKITNCIKKNQYSLERLIEECNIRINRVKENMCISHNDYKSSNIIWEKETPVLLDFDAVGLVNPYCAMAESAFNFTYSKRNMNLSHYKIYLKTYFENREYPKVDFKDILYVSVNGKLQWLSYLLSSGYEHDIINMIEELSFFYENINKLYEIYLSI
ncbi:MAG: phosphotransferase [Bacilli bacterium]|nr:phosphotransferase [Bacilli bacterium]